MREESALNMFRQMDLKGKAKDDTQLKTVHQNTIATIRSFDEAGGSVKKFSSELPTYQRFLNLFLTSGSERRRWESSHLVHLKINIKSKTRFHKGVQAHQA